MKVRGGHPHCNLWVDEVRGGHPFGLTKVRGGHPFGLMQISKIAKFKWFKWQNFWCTLSIIYSINPRGCPPLGTTSLGQAVVCIIVNVDFGFN